MAVTQTELEERDRLITEKGLVIVFEDSFLENDDECDMNHSNSITSNHTPKKTLVTTENAKYLENAGEGSLGIGLETKT